MIIYHPVTGNIVSDRISWKPRACFLMYRQAEIPDSVASCLAVVKEEFEQRQYTVIDALSRTTGRDFMDKIWTEIVAVPIGVAIIDHDMPPATMGNIYYELGLMHALGKETIVVRIGNVKVPSDFVRTEYIEFREEGIDQFNERLEQFFEHLLKQADYYLDIADQLKLSNPVVALDYYRRAHLLTGDDGIAMTAGSLLLDAAWNRREAARPTHPVVPLPC